MRRVRRLSARDPQSGTALVGSVVRLALVVGALALVWRAQHALEEWQRRAAIEFEFKMGLWFGWVIPAVLAGIVFGLAVWLPRGHSRYRWGRSILLGLPPLLLLLHFYVIFGVTLPHNVDLPDLLERTTPFWNAGPQFALAALLGIAVTSGFAESNREP